MDLRPTLHHNTLSDLLKTCLDVDKAELAARLRILRRERDLAYAAFSVADSERYCAKKKYRLSLSRLDFDAFILCDDAREAAQKRYREAAAEVDHLERVVARCDG